MGRSSTSCFKIISCGSDSVDKDDLGASESKGASDKRGWSFRKRSARHRVLSNTVNSETPPSGNKQSPESATVNFQTLINSSVPEKTSAVPQTDDKPELSTSINFKESETVVFTEDDSKADDILDESVIILIQSAIRGFLAQKEMLKLKNVVKLQAAVRGHLERRHAVGTLRCVQAIIKMQNLVRARRARVLLEGSCTEEKERHNSVTKPNLTTSIEKLLSNGFARQLLESTPRTKPINIKCDPSRSDSAWKWLERWMSVPSAGVEQSPKPDEQSPKTESKTEELEQEPEHKQEQEQEQEKVEHPTSQLEIEIPSEICGESRNLKCDLGDAASPSENEENLITYDANNFDFQACRPTLSSITDNQEEPHHENIGISISKENSFDSLANQTNPSDSISETELNSHCSKPEIEIEQPKRSSKRSAPEQLETDGKKSVFGSRKASNPAFIAAQSKFEELTSTVNSVKSISSSSQNGGVESNTDVALNSVVHTSMIPLGGSECGTELSISSTLDSRDGSEVEAIEVEHEAKVSEEETSNPKSTRSLDVETKAEESALGSDSYSIMVQPEKVEGDNDADGEPVNSVIPVDSSETKQNSEKITSDLKIEPDSETGHQAYKSSPEASPRSHITFPDSQTPSSQVSVKAKRTKGDKSGSNSKRRSLSAGKQSPSNPDRDSGARNSLEQLPKDNKTGKIRNSVGSSRPDPDHQEPRDSSSSNSLPSYMQATESARAKAHANSSPRSSPDVHDKDPYIKKRHSLPGANGRQGSPRIQRSMSQAQQGAKGNGSLSQERKWQR